MIKSIKMPTIIMKIKKNILKKRTENKQEPFFHALTYKCIFLFWISWSWRLMLIAAPQFSALTKVIMSPCSSDECAGIVMVILGSNLGRTTRPVIRRRCLSISGYLSRSQISILMLSCRRMRNACVGIVVRLQENVFNPSY